MHPPQNGTQMPKLGHDCCEHSDEWTIVRESRRTLDGFTLYPTVFSLKQDAWWLGWWHARYYTDKTAST